MTPHARSCCFGARKPTRRQTTGRIACQNAYPTEKAPLPSAAAHLDYGNASGKPEEWDFAVDVLRESLQLHPDDARSFRLLGEALAGKRDYVQAEEAFQQAL